MTALAQAREILMCNQAYMVGVICPSPDWDRFIVSEKLGVTAVVLVNPMVTKALSLEKDCIQSGVSSFSGIHRTLQL